MGLGGYRASDRKFLGMPGMHGTYEANMAMQHCDVLLAIGARFDDRVIGNPKHFAQNPRKIIHIDVDPSSISKRVKVDVPIVGDVRETLDDLLALLEQSSAAGNKAELGRAAGVVEADRRVAHARLPDATTALPSRSSRSSWSRSSGKSPRATRSSPRTSASTRCSPRSSTVSTSRGAGSIRAAWERWAWGCPTRWACCSRTPARRSRASPARARSRCASRSSPPASSTTCR